MNVDRWVEERVASLEAEPGWRPDGAMAWTRLRERDRAWRVRRRRWSWIAAAASLASLSVLAIPGRCDAPGSNSCGQPLAGRLWSEVFRKPPEAKLTVEVPQVKVAAGQPKTAAVTVAEAQASPPSAPARNSPQVPFKTLGMANASVTCEIYTDYECPACAVLYRDTIPLLVAQYVQTGKVRILHRDFPLAQHPYARLAARYANAAGRFGQYDAVVDVLFRTQNLWVTDGSMDKEVTQVLPPGVMQKVRSLVQNDGSLDDTVEADVAMATQDGIVRTPTIVVVSHGRRQAIAGVPAFELLKSYLDQVLEKK